MHGLAWVSHAATRLEQSEALSPSFPTPAQACSARPAACHAQPGQLDLTPVALKSGQLDLPPVMPEPGQLDLPPVNPNPGHLDLPPVRPKPTRCLFPNKNTINNITIQQWNINIIIKISKTILGVTWEGGKETISIYKWYLKINPGRISHRP